MTICRFSIMRLAALAILIGLSTPGCINSRAVFDLSPPNMAEESFQPWVDGEVILRITDDIRESTRKKFLLVLRETLLNGGGIRSIKGHQHIGKTVWGIVTHRGTVTLTIKFHGEGDINDWAEVVHERLEQAQHKFPRGVKMPRIQTRYGQPNKDTP